MKKFMPWILAVVATAGSYGISFWQGWTTLENTSYIELGAVLTSYVSVLMCVYQLRLNYAVGIVCTLLYSILFYQYEMYAVSAFNLYLVFSQLYGWFRWGPDDTTKPVQSVSPYIWWLGYAWLGIGIYGLLYGVNSVFGVTITNIEIWITVLSGVAQFLLDNKKIETWGFWAVVNILSVYFFFEGGLYLAAIQYLLFLGNTAYGYIEWRKSCQQV